MIDIAENTELSPEINVNGAVLRRKQLKYVTSLESVIQHAGVEGNEVFPADDDSLRGVAKLISDGIVFNRKVYKLPHTAAIACEVLYGERWKPVDGWKFWNTVVDGKIVSLEDLRERYLDMRMVNGDCIAED